MEQKKIWIAAVVFFVLMMIYPPAFACTTFIVTKGASADGSAYVGHTNDGFGAGIVGPSVQPEMSQLIYVPPADYPRGRCGPVRFDPNSGSDEPADAKSNAAAEIA